VDVPVYDNKEDMSNSFAGKVVTITGAAQGIGLATAHLLAARGASLCLADIQEEALGKLSAEMKATYNVDVIPCAVDVRKREQVDSWIKKIIDHFGRLDGAANLAGVIGKNLGKTGIVDQDEDEWDFLIAVNLTGVMHCLRAQMRVIEKGGSIVNAASISGLIGRPNSAAYSATKHGVLGLTRSAAKEVGKEGTRVNAIAPYVLLEVELCRIRNFIADSYTRGPILTPMNSEAQKISSLSLGKDSDASRIAIPRWGEAEEVASLIAFLLSSESKFITGATYNIDGGWFC
jgi:NAD(P)-dependent dehydrogenase (short-subunit alcohol dehydrogenase family)